MSSSVTRNEVASTDLVVGAIIQARMSSHRLPGKSLRDLGGTPILDWVIRAVEASNELDKMVVATSSDASDNEIADYCQSQGIAVYRGALDDVLTRFTGALNEYSMDGVVRITADCPFLDPEIIDTVVRAWRNDPNLDYVATIFPRSLPRGLDVEIAAAAALNQANEFAVETDRSHVTSYLYREPDRFRTKGVVFRTDASDLRVTLDTDLDLALLSGVVEQLGNRIIPHRELIAFLREHPELVATNSGVRQKTIDEA